MKRIQKLETVADYCRFFGINIQHPLVTVADFADYGSYPEGEMASNLYCVMYKELECGELRYGRSKYDYEAGTLLFMSPGQTMELCGHSKSGTPESKGCILMFHSDLMYGTPLARCMKDYSFFSYDSSEALHMSEREKTVILNLIKEIKDELDSTIDKHTKQIVCSSIETLLNRCVRFYERQFVTREISNRHVIGKLDELLRNYFDNNLQQQRGIPSVQYCAGEICLSPNYFSDLIRKETGKTALEYIQNYVIERAKVLLGEGIKSVSEVAYELGFKYPHHLTRVFKRHTGVTPTEYKAASN